MKELVFVSSVQKELASERKAVRDFIRGDALLGQYFDVFLFEDSPANDGAPDQLYIQQVDRSAVYLAILGNEYGWEDADGFSPTEREFDRATLKRKNRLVFVKGSDDAARHPKMRALVRKAERQLTRRRFEAIPDLAGKVYASLIQHLERRGVLPQRPFDAAACPRASVADISREKIEWFLQRAREERKFALSAKATTENTLTHLNLLDGKHPSNAAVLLFGRDPQRFLPAAEVKCLHFHGTEVVKPIPSYQVFKGTLFDQVGQAVDFVQSKLARSVAPRVRGPRADVEHEIPRPVLAEAIINAVAHRDYASAAGVQVYVFADRVEVWNPGELPPSLTPESLRQVHPSLPRNPLIAEELFLAHFIEKAGTGTLDVIAGCQAADLPEPDFEQNGDQFVLRLWRDWLTADVIAGLNLSDRQLAGLNVLKLHREITTMAYQKVVGCPKRTAIRDLDDLIAKGVIERTGAGRGAHYVLPRNRATNVPIVPSPADGVNRAKNAPIVPPACKSSGRKPRSQDTGQQGDRKGTKGTQARNPSSPRGQSTQDRGRAP